MLPGPTAALSLAVGHLVHTPMDVLPRVVMARQIRDARPAADPGPYRAAQHAGVRLT